MSKTAIDISALSSKELKALLEEKEATERAEKEAKRKEYESEREALITALGDAAVEAENKIRALKRFAFQQLAEWREKMLAYGDLRRGEKNKGNFSIQNELFKIEFTHQIRKAFDERAELAEDKLRQFMNTFLKRKAHKDVVDIISALLERNTKTGEYDINLINRLYAMKDRFNDKNWQEAIELFQESYSPSGTAQYVRFFTRNIETNGWDAIIIDLAKVRI